MLPLCQTTPVDENFKEYEELLQYGLQDTIDRIDAGVRLEADEIRRTVRVSTDQLLQHFTV